LRKANRKFKVFVEGYGTIEVNEGANLGQALASAGIIDLPCGGRGLCGSCLIRVFGKVSEPTGNELVRGLGKEFRLACQTRVLGDLKVQVLIKRAPPVSQKSMLIPVKTPNPLIIVKELAPSLTQTFPFPVNIFSTSVIGEKAALIGFSIAGYLSGTTKKKDDVRTLLIDLGTTKIAYQLIDRKGGILSEGTTLNPQGRYGADVMTRLGKALESDEAFKELMNSVRSGVSKLLKEVGGDICFLAGNSAMESLFLGLPVEQLAMKPYQPYLKGPITTLLDNTPCLIAPMVGGHVGGDSFMDLVAAEGINSSPPYMIIDIGTNTEVLLVLERSSGKELVVASAPAGPAFEGHLTSGITSVSGGITEVRISGFNEDNSPIFDVFGKAPGMTGSGIVSLVTELLRHGLLTPSGRLVKGYVDTPYGKGLIIDKGSENVPPTVFTQKDVREFQKALSAVKTAWEIVLKETSLEPSRLRQLFISGNFGSNLNLRDALELKLIPPVEESKVVIGGNMVLSGLRASALSRTLFMKVWGLAEKARHIELAESHEFRELWIRNLSFA